MHFAFTLRTEVELIIQRRTDLYIDAAVWKRRTYGLDFAVHPSLGLSSEPSLPLPQQHLRVQIRLRLCLWFLLHWLDFLRLGFSTHADRLIHVHPMLVRVGFRPIDLLRAARNGPVEFRFGLRGRRSLLFGQTREQVVRGRPLHVRFLTCDQSSVSRMASQLGAGRGGMCSTNTVDLRSLVVRYTAFPAFHTRQQG